MLKTNKNGDDTPTIIVEGPSRENLQDIPYVDEGEARKEYDDGIDCEAQVSRRGSLATHRKNSISLPNLEELKILNEKQEQVSLK